ncbi:MAG: spermidine/putrescine ABC transporter substrate-binding protein, partial [Schwartzia sp. (in: firmicutes)]
MKNVLHILGVLALALCAVVFSGCGGEKTAKRELKVYNAGDYIDPDLIKAFEKETGIRIIYDTWATNEDMYVKVKAGGSDYDLVIPSDYMIERMRRE